MAFKQCVCKNHPNHHMEYDDLEVRSKFVTPRTDKKTHRELTHEGKWKITTLKKEILTITHPSHAGPKIDILNSEKNQYFLVVNHTTNAAFPVRKDLFRQAYEKPTPAKKKDVKGDKNLAKKPKKAPEKVEKKSMTYHP